MATQRNLGDDVFLWGRRWFCTHKHSVLWMAALTAAFQELLKGTQPATNQVDVLQGCNSVNEVTGPNHRNPTSVTGTSLTCNMTQWPSLAAFSMASSATASWPWPSETLCSFPKSMVNPSFRPRIPECSRLCFTHT